jgi:hypothetical protein
MAIFEPLKFYFQGYKNLQETLVAYPLIFLICDTLLLLKFKNKDNYFRKIFFSVALFFAIFSMLPTWFACILVFILRLVHTKTDKKILFLPFLTLFFLLGLVIPYKDYLIETIYNNIFFLLPNSGYTLNLVNIIFMPFGPFIPPYINQKIIFGLLILFLIYQVFLLIKKTKNFNIPILIIALLYLTNFLQVDDFKFSSFHLLPWVVSLITINILLSYLFLKKYISSKKINFYYFLVILISFILLISNESLIKKKNFANEFYINYSLSETYGRVISLLKDKDDQLFVYPNDPLIYYSAKILPPTKVIEHYSWIYNSPKYKDEVFELFNKKSPSFVVIFDLNKNNKIDSFILEKLKKNYINIKHVNKQSHLYILKKKIQEIDSEQKKQAQNLLFVF